MLQKIDYESIKKDVFNFLIGFGVIVLYYLSQYFATVPLNLLNIDIDKMSYIAKTIYLILFQLGIMTIIFLIYRKELLKQFQEFKQKKDQYFKQYFKFWFLLLAGMMISNYIILIFNNGQIANNEQGIRDIFGKNPIYVYIASVLIAPIIEELVFRYSVRKIIKSDILFIICSGLIFGLAHVIGQTEALIDYLYIIPYSIPGFVFGYLLVKTDNIFSSISMHMFHNGILITLQFFLYFFGN